MADIFDRPCMHGLTPTLILQNNEVIFNLDQDRRAALVKEFKASKRKFAERDGLVITPKPPEPVYFVRAATLPTVRA